jgi:CBS-domain-containing membrane protein|tara:strand:- start:301 stop:696 length:396 start_codon:yes stop_codon:yes gene_type:complete
MSTAAKVRDYMATRLVALSPETEILRAVNILLKHDIASAPVVDEAQNLVDILIERDCIRVALNAGYHSEYGGQVSDYMSKDVQTIAAEDCIVDAVKAFFGQRFHRYPVMEDGRLVGYLSRRDVMHALGKLR